MLVKQYTGPLTFDRWDRTTNLTQIALQTVSEAIRIRTRLCPDGLFSRQLHLNDLLDAAEAILPIDAYAILLLVDHDLYEDDDDDFCCGRAYGASRIAVVSSARYTPLLDAHNKIDREHVWPASHCQAYVNTCCGANESTSRRANDSGDPMMPQDELASSAMRAAVDAFQACPPIDDDLDRLQALWSSRVVRTVVHELGHCFGLDHCVYYACNMQGTASMAEDLRQPPYLCPIDSAKIFAATGGDFASTYQALLEFCDARPGVHMLAAFAAWLRTRLRTMT
ncbi:hypothetical protein MRB53_040718 [Persea americana]|nr:hypothetical protein MRB53_040718 [Persea americana]